MHGMALMRVIMSKKHGREESSSLGICTMNRGFFGLAKHQFCLFLQFSYLLQDICALIVAHQCAHAYTVNLRISDGCFVELRHQRLLDDVHQ